MRLLGGLPEKQMKQLSNLIRESVHRAWKEKWKSTRPEWKQRPQTGLWPGIGGKPGKESLRCSRGLQKLFTGGLGIAGDLKGHWVDGGIKVLTGREVSLMKETPYSEPFLGTLFAHLSVFDFQVNVPREVKMETCNGSVTQHWVYPQNRWAHKEESTRRSRKEETRDKVKAIIFCSGSMSVAQDFRKIFYNIYPVLLCRLLPTLN